MRLARGRGRPAAGRGFLRAPSLPFQAQLGISRPCPQHVEVLTADFVAKGLKSVKEGSKSIAGNP